jgi:hypothetical protein
MWESEITCEDSKMEPDGHRDRRIMKRYFEAWARAALDLFEWGGCEFCRVIKVNFAELFLLMFLLFFLMFS